jgi:hypothetical protein
LLVLGCIGTDRPIAAMPPFSGTEPRFGISLDDMRRIVPNDFAVGELKSGVSFDDILRSTAYLCWL